MLNVGKIENGIVLDHIEAGKAMLIYHYLHLDREDYQVAIIKNARSNDMGRKDILKVECDPDTLSLDAVALIEPNTTVNIIKGGVIVEKKKMDMPKEVYGVLKCHNPRCISSIEQELPHIFFLADYRRKIYRCRYCEEKYSAGEREKWFR